MPRRVWMSVLASLCALTMMVGCGGGGPADGGGDRGGNDGGTPIGPNGGTVNSSDGQAVLVVPAGALETMVHITVANLSNEPEGAVGTVYDFGPDGTQFAVPATLSLRYDEAALPPGVEVGELVVAMVREDIWVPLETTLDAANQALTAQVAHFTEFGNIPSPESGDGNGEQEAPIDLNGLWLDNGRDVRITQTGSDVTALYVEPYICDHQDGTGETSETDLDFHATLQGNKLTGETSTCFYGPSNPFGVGIRPAYMELTVSDDHSELTGTYHNDFYDTDLPMALYRQHCEDSGVHWHPRFPGSTDTADLTPAFRTVVDNFIAALQDAGATVEIESTLRPPERAYLMHYAFRIAREGLDPASVPEMEGVNICWMHEDAAGNPDRAASVAAATDMVRAYNIAFRPALTSRHTEGRAIDMNITWTGDLVITNSSGHEITISSRPRSGQNADLHTVGASYGVIKLVNDPPHWSDDGH